MYYTALLPGLQVYMTFWGFRTQIEMSSSFGWILWHYHGYCLIDGVLQFENSSNSKDSGLYLSTPVYEFPSHM